MTRRYIPEERNPHLRRCENLETHKIYDKTSNCKEQVHASVLIAQASSTRSLQEIFGPSTQHFVARRDISIEKMSSNSFHVKAVIESRSNFENLFPLLFMWKYIILLINFVKMAKS